MPAVREIRQLTEPIKYQRYPTVLYLVKMNFLDNITPIIMWKVPDFFSDELMSYDRDSFQASLKLIPPQMGATTQIGLKEVYP